MTGSIWEWVQAARERQRVGFEGSDIICNSYIRVAEVRQFCKLNEVGDNLALAAMGRLNLSARGYHRVLKLVRTIADLAEALPLRPAEGDDRISGQVVYSFASR